MTEYREIPGMPGYRAGSDGSIWSRKTHNSDSAELERRKQASFLRSAGLPYSKIAETLNYSCAAAAFKAIRANSIPPRWEKLKSWKDRRGYLNVGTRRHQKYRAHRLVLLAFKGDCPPGMEACHDNNLRSDNRPENLRWDSHRNNLFDRVRHGTTNDGERNGKAKLTLDAVRKIRELYSERRYSQSAIGGMFGVSGSTVSMVITGKRWKEAS